LHLTYFFIWLWQWDPSMWLFISLMCNPSFILGYRGWSLLHNIPF
jgi:hypothetical protein